MTCLNCEHWKPKESAQMARLGFAYCSLGSKWAYKPPQHECIKFKPAKPDIQAARQKWIQKNG